MESEHFLFNRTMSRELHEKWQKELSKKPLNRRYLPLEDPVQIIRGVLHQRYWNNDSMGLSMSLAAINWWNFDGKQKVFTKAGLDQIITSGRFDHNEARRNKSETEISQGPAMYVYIREYPWSILSNASEFYTLQNWQIPVHIGRGHCMGDMENLTSVRSKRQDIVMEPTYDQFGVLTKVRGKFGYGRSVSLARWNGEIYLHINDDSKCWVDGKSDKTLAKSLSMKWTDALALRQLLVDLDSYANHFESDQYLKPSLNETEPDGRINHKLVVDEVPTNTVSYLNKGNSGKEYGLRRIQTNYRHYSY